MSVPRQRLRPVTAHRPGQDPACAGCPPLSIAEARCNRCGGCLTLGCPAISDLGGEALVIDAATCTGCGACQPLCRARAIGPALRLLA